MSTLTSKIRALTKDNYDTWVMQIEAVMTKNGTWKYVNGKMEKPKLIEGDPKSVETVEKWEEEDAKAKADIIIAIDSSLLRLVKGLSNAKQVWDRLKSEFASTGPVRKASLLKRVATYKMSEGEDLRNHLMEFFDAVAQLASMDIEIHPELLSILLLNGLPTSFEVFRCAIESRDVIPTPGILREKILEEYDVRNQRQKDDSSEAMWVDRGQKWSKRNSKYSGYGVNSSSNNKNRASGQKQFIFRCYKCHQQGHKATECPKKGAKEISRNVEEELFRGEKVTDENTFCINEDIFDKALQLQLKPNKEKWCLDSGCTSHICSDKEMFISTPTSVVNKKLLLASDTHVDVMAKGTARMTASNGETFKLYDTLLVEDLRTNLLSVAKITDRNNTVIFSKSGAIVKGENGETKLIAKRVGNLYYVCNDSEETNWASTRNNHVSIDTWHCRLGHLNEKDLTEMLKKNFVDQVNIKRKLQPCDICIRGKMTTLPFPKKSDRKTGVLDLVHSDVWGPSRTESLGKARYFVTFIDDCSRWCEVYFIRNKSDVLRVFKEYKARMERQTGRKIKCLMSDNGGEYCNHDFDVFLKQNGIRHRLTVSNTPQQNGVAERKNRSLVDITRCLLIQSGLSKGFWAETVYTANYLRNRCPSKSLNGCTPFEVLYETSPNLNHLRVFGSRVFVLNKDTQKDKLEDRSIEGIMIGYSEESKGYRIWLNEARKVVTARDVKFFEETIPGIKSYESNGKILNKQEEKVEIPVEMNTKISTNRASSDGSMTEISMQETEMRNETTRSLEENTVNKKLVRGAGRPRFLRSGSRGRPRKIYSEREINTEDNEEANDEGDVMSHNENQIDIVSNENFENDNQDDLAAIVTSDLVGDISFREAVNGKDSEEWMKVIAEEIRNLIRNNTWDLVNRPKNRDVVTCRTILRNKIKPDGSLERRKARVVARGFSQRKGIDYSETFAPVARLESVRFLMALAAQKNLMVYQMDIVAAYLNGDLDEEIYMELPNLIEDSLSRIIKEDGEESDLGREACKMMQILKGGDKVCRLKKALYGLRQAGRQWNKKLDQILRELGLKPTANDICLYHSETENEFTFLVVYVDDILYMSNSLERLSIIKNGLRKVFDVKDLGSASFCLGIEIRQQDGEIQLSQRRYMQNLLEKFGMEEANPVSTPSDLKVKMDVDKMHHNKENRKDYPYRELIGSLMYLAVGTRPDIAFTVNKLAQFNETYQDKHWAAAKRVLRYLQGTKDYGLIYKKNDAVIYGFADADYANDVVDRKSYTGYVFMLSGSAVVWRSQKQKSVAISTTEAEYVAISEATREAVYLKQLMFELKLSEFSRVILATDNRGAKCIAENAVCHSRTKHIDVRYHFVREMIREKKIELIYTPTGLMSADIFTKALPGPTHYRCMEELGMKKLFS